MSEYAAAELALEDAQPGARNDPDTSYLKENARSAAVKDITFGSVAGMVGKVVEYPFDTIKVRLQSQPSTGPARYAGPLDCFQQSLREGGVRSLYRGISAPMFGAAVETSSLFFSYRLAQKAMHRALDLPAESSGRLPLSALLVCGGASGAFTSALLTPIELVKCQMQVPAAAAKSATALPNPVTIIAAIYRHQGIQGFWRGQLGTLIRETGGSAAWFGSYEGVCAAFRASSASTLASASLELGPEPKQKLSVGHQLLAGASAGMAYNFICYPADTVKSRMQTEDVGALKRETFWRVARQLWREQGVRGMYRGCGITVARAAPSSAVIFAVYETLLGWWT